MKNIIKSNDLVFDVGANNGNKSQEFLDLGASVIAVEPNPACIKQLEVRFKDNKNITIIQKGVSYQNEMREFSICDCHVLSTFSEVWKKGRFKDYSWPVNIEVNMTTLDDLIYQFGLPKYCKIDVEGFELEVLQGLSVIIPYISFEFVKENLKALFNCMDRLYWLGYREFNIKIGEDETFMFSNWKSRDLVYANIKYSDNLDLWGDIYAREI